MSAVEDLPMASTPTAATVGRDRDWLRAARRARWLSWFSLGWMIAEGAVGLVAGAEAHSLGVVSWAIGSVVEGAAAVIVIVRLTGANRFSHTAEARAQRWVAGSFFALIPFIGYEAISRLLSGDQPQGSLLAIAILVSSIVLMPALGIAKRRLGQQLDSGATSGEGTQNLLCAMQGAVGLIGLLAGSAGAAFLDPVAALVIVGIAAKEGSEMWRGDDCACRSMPGFAPASTSSCSDDCECCS